MSIKAGIAMAAVLALFAADASAATHRHVRHRRPAPAPAAVAPAPSPPAPEGCDRTCLYGRVDKVLQATVDHKPAEAGLATDARYTENGQTVAPGSGLWSSATAIALEGDGMSSLGVHSSAYRLYFANAADGEAGYIGALTENGAPAIMALRVKVAPKGGPTTEAEALVVREKDGGAFPLKPRGYSEPDKSLLAADGTMARGDLLGVINQYFMAMRGDAGVAPPMDPACIRLINGERYGCAPWRVAAVRGGRVMMADVDRGLVLVDSAVDGLDGTSRLEADLFKIRAGKITRMQSLFVPTAAGATTGWSG